MLKQGLHQKLLQKLSPQQIQLMKLLQVPTIELEQRIKEEIEINPALEEGAEEKENDELEEEEEDQYEGAEVTDSQKEIDLSQYIDDDETPSYKTSISNRSSDDEERSMPFSESKTFHDSLNQQITMLNLTDDEEKIGLHIIGSLDDDGYLRREVNNIVDDLAFSQNINATDAQVAEVLKAIQSLDPAGIGARSLQECLYLQLERIEPKDAVLVLSKEIIKNHFEAFSKKHYDKIIAKLEIDEEYLKEAIEEIIKLNPKPGNSEKSDFKNMPTVIPDFLISSEDDKLSLVINSRNAPELKISKGYSEMLQTYAEASKRDKSQKEAVLFVKQKIDAAKWFIDAIKQRQSTLLYTMNAIMEFQRDYFLTGDETKLRPMILKDIAEIVSLDISTISRVANSKYVQTTYGTFLLKTFFSESLSTDSGEEVSTREVKKILQNHIEAEDKRKPLTDEKLMDILKENGYNIARRTVAKYREMLNIPVARLRKEL